MTSLTPAELLQESQWSASEVEILAIDAEGLDEQILKLFLQPLGNFSSCFYSRLKTA